MNYVKITTVITLLLNACGHNTPQPKNCIILGDSISYGVGATTFTDGFAYQVCGKDAIIHNYAKRGSKIEEQIAIMNTIELNQLDTVVWLTGYNDVRYGTTIESYSASLRAALSYIPSKVLLAGCLPMKSIAYSLGTPYDKATKESIDEYSNAISSIAHEYSNVKFIDVSSFNAELYMGPDNIHPSQLGHNVLAHLFLK